MPRRSTLGGWLLPLLEEGVGDEVGHLEQVVGVGASERGASHDSLYGDVLRPLALVPRLLPAGTRGCGSRACDRRGAARGKIQRKLGDDSDNPTYIFTEPRVGYRMPKGDVGRGDGMAVTSWLCGFSIRYNSLRSRHGRPSLRSDTPGII